jgi:hypothetical protein
MSRFHGSSQRPRVFALGLAAGLALLGSDPCGPLPGGALSGEAVTEPIGDWAFVDDQGHCQLEVRPAEPYSVTTYCFADGESLYVPAIMGDSKQWTKLAVANPDARIRIGERIYPVTLERLVAPADRRAAAEAGHRHHHGGAEPPADFEVKEDRWYFRATSR